ncbi:MAG: hypothetical protein U5N86_00805 [Planctomycetota bacterium]|nr:hypothetical protein [Planctomycetota bacterium]
MRVLLLNGLCGFRLFELQQLLNLSLTNGRNVNVLEDDFLAVDAEYAPFGGDAVRLEHAPKYGSDALSIELIASSVGQIAELFGYERLDDVLVAGLADAGDLQVSMPDINADIRFRHTNSFSSSLCEGNYKASGCNVTRDLQQKPFRHGVHARIFECRTSQSVLSTYRVMSRIGIFYTFREHLYPLMSFR